MINVLILCDSFKDLIEVSNNTRRCIEDSMCIISTSSIQEARSLIAQRDMIIDIFIVSMHLKSGSGYCFEKEIRKHPVYRNAPFIFLTRNAQDFRRDLGLPPHVTYRERVFTCLPVDSLDIQSKIWAF